MNYEVTIAFCTKYSYLYLCLNTGITSDLTYSEWVIVV